MVRLLPPRFLFSMPRRIRVLRPEALRISADPRSRLQVLRILDNGFLTRNPLHTHDAVPDIPKTAPAGYSGDGILHPVCSVDGGSHCGVDRAVGTIGEREWEL
jgi:hypothetical protein